MEAAQDENTRRQLEQELNVQIVPGTEVMLDNGTGNHRFVKPSASSNRVLVPQPSDDPHDPLNWSNFWKFATLTCVSAATFMQAVGSLAIAPMFPDLVRDFDSNLADVIDFNGITILVLGFSNFLWVPLSTSFGRRPVLIASTIVCLASCVWRARAQSYSSFYGACILNGIGAGPTELWTIQPAVIADIMFLDRRGTYNSLYFMSYVGALMIGPIIAGPMAQYTGWRNFWWLNVALLALVTIMLIFGFPETKWHRLHQNKLDQRGLPTATSSAEKFEPDTKGGSGDLVTRNVSQDLADSPTESQDHYLGKGKPSRSQFGFYQPNSHPFKSMLLDVWIPWKLFAFPIVEFAAFVVSWSCSSFLTLNLTQSEVFAPPPYDFSPVAVGFTNFAIVVGALIGLATAGPLSDWISMRLTIRNGGVREPEMRLPSMIPYVLIMMLGNFIVAFGYEHRWSWKVIVIIGYACAGIQVAALPAITSTYAVDSYKPVSGSIFVAITVNKNLWGYGFSKFITPWIEKGGFVEPIMTNMALTVLWCLFGVLFWFKGKTFRTWTRNDSVHRM